MTELFDDKDYDNPKTNRYQNDSRFFPSPVATAKLDRSDRIEEHKLPGSMSRSRSRSRALSRTRSRSGGNRRKRRRKTKRSRR